MTALSFIPAFVMLMTSFTRIVIVFAILRQALGLQTTPSNQVLVGMALFLTLFIMAPVFDRINTTAVQPYLNEQLSAQDAINRAQVPMKDFMLAQTRQSDLDLFMRLSKRTDIASPDQAPLSILVPAFVTSELKTAFQIGFMIFIPLPGDRPGDRQCADGHGHDDAVADDHFPAVQADAVRAGRWLGVDHGHPGQQLRHRLAVPLRVEKRNDP
ncbi:flagellar biosynthetic protein FliP [Pseudomonas psychrotolerans]|nr:flagellar biosynthetic protein FliP [Pseudomonas psychrotolerans]